MFFPIRGGWAAVSVTPENAAESVLADFAPCTYNGRPFMKHSGCAFPHVSSKSSLISLATSLALWVLIVGCGGNSNSMTPELTSITITPAALTIAAGSSQQFTATGNFTDGSTKDLSSTATWSSSHASVASVSRAGRATAAGDGTTNIIATKDGVNGSTVLIVQSGTPDPLGTATASQTTCAAGGVTATACYSLVISCPGIADTNAIVKV